MTFDGRLENKTISPKDIPEGLILETRPPQSAPFGEESLEFHATRLILLIYFAGGAKHRIVGRTKIAKLDFFVRYPTYLAKAAQIKHIETKISSDIRPESTMIRYKYGPWDEKYYNIFALLVARGFVHIYPSDKGDVFELTNRGGFVVDELNNEDFQDIIQRCQLVNKIFKSETGTEIKNFIYNNFPEIVAMSLGEEIER